MKFEIKTRLADSVLFSIETASKKLAVEVAVKQKINLTGADLTGADLTGAYLTGAYLTGAYLRGADLTGAYLRGADLTGADLAGADLTGADLTGAKGINPNRCTPLRILLDQPGKIRAYKLVNSGGEGPYNGGIEYHQGGEYQEPDANTDENVQCAAGINLATLDWCMKEWRDGYRILIAEFEATDIAVIPIATDGKFRVRKCKIVGERDLTEIGLIEKKEGLADNQQFQAD